MKSDHKTVSEDRRTRLIGKIYEIALAPESYDDFMVDWEKHISSIASELQKLQASSGLLDDPALEAHFNRAFAILERQGRGAQPGADIGDKTPVLTVSRDASLQANAAARQRFAAIRQFDDLEQVLLREDWNRLKSALANLRRAPQTGRIMILRLDGRTGEAGDSGYLTVVSGRDERSGQITLRMTPLELTWTTQFEAVLVSSFDLSSAELRLVEALAAGNDLARLAQGSGRTLNTLRSQLKSVFRKTRTSSQADLMRVIAILSQLGSEHSATATDNGTSLDTGRVEMLTLSEERPVPVHFIGPEDGIPVIFVHGMLDGIAVTRSISGLLKRKNIRLIAPVRSNFGFGPADDRVAQAPSVFASDIAILTETLEIEHCLIAGHMAGSLYAFAAAGSVPAIRGVIAIAGGVPISSVSQFSTMAPRQRAVAYTARYAPALLPMVLRAGIAQIDSADPSAFMQALYRRGSPDARLVDNPAVALAILDGYRFAVAQGHWAFQADSYHVTRDWSALVRMSECPVVLLHGRHDPVVNIATVAGFAKSLGARATFSPFNDCGQLLFYQQPEQVLEAIVRLWTAAVPAET